MPRWVNMEIERGVEKCGNGWWRVAFECKRGTRLSWWVKEIVWEVPSYKTLGLILNEQSSCICCEWNLLAAVSYWPLPLCCITGIFLGVALGQSTRCALLFHWRGTGMHTGMPLSAFVDAHDHCSQILTKTFCWGSVSSTPWRNPGYGGVLDLNGNCGAPRC